MKQLNKDELAVLFVAFILLALLILTKSRDLQ